MAQMTDPIKETHEGKQRINLLLMLYFFIVLGVSMVIAFRDVWPITFFQELMADEDNMYPVKTVFMLNFLAIGAVFFPAYWILKKVIEKKNTSEAMAMPLGMRTGEKEFSFSYSAAVNTVIIDNMYMEVKMGFVKRSFPVSRIKNFYLLSKSSFQTLHISYEDESGKIKKCPLNAEAGEPELAKLVAELESRFPDKSLNNLSQAEALKIMKVMSPALMVAIILGVIFLVLGLIIFFVVNSSSNS